MFLPENDQYMPITHGTHISFYESPTVVDLPPSTITHLLTTSLSRALSLFYPLAGRLHSTSRTRHQLNLNSAGALFLEAESTETVEDFGDFCPTPEIRRLIPSVDYTRPIHEIPLLIVQITKFACGGMSLGVGVQHSICDGRAVFHFMSEWARICRGESPENLPFLDRSALNLGDCQPGFEFDGPDPVLIDGPGPEEVRRKETTVVMLQLSKDHIGRLKKMVNQDTSEQGKPFTRFEVLTAHIWRCISIARYLKDEQLTRLRIPIDFRRKIDPPLPDKYFGNAILTVTTEILTKDLLLQPLSYVTERMRKDIKKVSNEYVKSFLVHLRNIDDFNTLRYRHVVGSTKGAFRGNPNMAITSWLGLTNGIDFGWGKEIYTGPGLVGFDGKAFLLDNYDDNDGSIRVVLRLQTTHVDTFTKLFYENLY